MLKYIVPLAALLLTGCVTAEVREAQIAKSTPLPSETRRTIANYIKHRVKDPYSIRDAEISYAVPNDQHTKAGTRYVCVGFNAKNSYGAYAGHEYHALGLNRDNTINDIWWRAPHCRNNAMMLKWQSFPELNGR